MAGRSQLGQRPPRDDLSVWPSPPPDDSVTATPLPPDEPAGENPPEGALLTFWVKEFTGDEVKIAITNSAGQPVANLKAGGTPGFNRVSWDLRPTEDVRIKYGGDDPKKFVPGGDYTAELSYGREKMKQIFRVEIAEGIVTR